MIYIGNLHQNNIVFWYDPIFSLFQNEIINVSALIVSL